MGMLKSKAYDQKFYEEHASWGIDFAYYGEWQVKYGKWLVDALQLQSKWILDVGCACGANTLGIAVAGTQMVGIDVSEFMITKGREIFPLLRSRLYIGDAVNMHLFPDEYFDCVHMQQVAEHWKPNLVLPTLEELHRVTRPGGILVSFHATLEEYVRRGRIKDFTDQWEHEDPTHLSLRRQAYWRSMFAAAGWELAEDLDARLREHPQSMIASEGWDYLVARRGENAGNLRRQLESTGMFEGDLEQLA